MRIGISCTKFGYQLSLWLARAVVKEGLARVQATVLHATEAGRPVYERMGYAPISTHMLFIEKRFLEGH